MSKPSRARWAAVVLTAVTCVVLPMATTAVPATAMSPATATSPATAGVVSAAAVDVAGPWGDPSTPVTFTATGGQTVRWPVTIPDGGEVSVYLREFSAQPAGASAQLQLVNAAGTVVASQQVTDGANDLGDFMLTARVGKGAFTVRLVPGAVVTSMTGGLHGYNAEWRPVQVGTGASSAFAGEGRIVRYQFTAKAGQLLQANVVRNNVGDRTSRPAGVTWSVESVDGRQVLAPRAPLASFVSKRARFTIPADGSYVVRVEGRSSSGVPASGQFWVDVSPLLSTSIPAGGSDWTNFTTSTPEQLPEFAVDVTARGSFSAVVDRLTPTGSDYFNGVLRVYDAVGNVVSGSLTMGPTPAVRIARLDQVAPGRYYLVIDNDYDNAVMSGRIALWRDQRHAVAPDGTPFAYSLRAGQGADFTFTAIAGQDLSLTNLLTAQSGSLLSTPHTELIGPDGTVIPYDASRTLRLAMTGTYTFHIDWREAFSIAATSGELRLAVVAPRTVPVSLGSPTTWSGTSGQVVELPFSVATPGQLDVIVPTLKGGESAPVSVVAPDGTAVELTELRLDVLRYAFTASTSGTYRVVVRPQPFGSLSGSLSIVRRAGGWLAPGSAALNLPTPGQWADYRFHGDAGVPVSITISDPVIRTSSGLSSRLMARVEGRWGIVASKTVTDGKTATVTFTPRVSGTFTFHAWSMATPGGELATVNAGLTLTRG